MSPQIKTALIRGPELTEGQDCGQRKSSDCY